MAIYISGSAGSTTISGSTTTYTSSGSISVTEGSAPSSLLGALGPATWVSSVHDHGVVTQDFVLSQSVANTLLFSCATANVTASLGVPGTEVQNGTIYRIYHMGANVQFGSGGAATVAVSASNAPTSDGAGHSAFLAGISTNKQVLTMTGSTQLTLQYFTASAARTAHANLNSVKGYYIINDYRTLSGSALDAILGLNSVS